MNKNRLCSNFLCATIHTFKQQHFCSGDKIKKINFVNKALYGAVTKKTKKSSTPTSSIVEDSATDHNESFSGEIYWLVTHAGKFVDEPLAPGSAESATKRKPIKSVGAKVSNAEKINSLLNTKVQDKPVRKRASQMKIIHTVSANKVPEIITPRISDISTPSEPAYVPSIVFSPKQLRSVLTVPAFGLVDWTGAANMPHLPDGMQKLPSVTKILQATMSETSRKALLQWKLLKIAELGEDGFNEMQQSELWIRKIETLIICSFCGFSSFNTRFWISFSIANVFQHKRTSKRCNGSRFTALDKREWHSGRYPTRNRIGGSSDCASVATL